jgi:uncharacterized protein (TIGR03437 family)
VVAPGELVAIRGYGLGPVTGTQQPTGVQVFFGNYAAPLLYAQSQQINVQVPWEIAGQSITQMRVEFGGVAETIPVSVVSAVPGIFSVSNSDGSINSPANPAKAGDFITIYGTGGGLTAPLGITGAFWPLATSQPGLTLTTSITIGGADASVIYAGASPLSPSGVFQINARLPSNIPASSASSLVLTIGGASSPAGSVTIATKQ